MASERGRLAQIFIWRQAAAPDIEYARQVLSVVNPDALRLLSGDNPPLSLFTVYGPWPSNPWGIALRDMRTIPAPDGTHWTDATRYDLAGWHGADSRTGQSLFVVTAYRKANAPAPDTFQGAPAPAPPYTPPTTSIQQVPFYPDRPTGPVAWPPAEPVVAPDVANVPTVPSGRQTGVLPSYTTRYYSRDQPSVTGPLGNIVPPVPLAESYAPYYAGFPVRLLAGLIDLLCVVVLGIGAFYLYAWLTGYSAPGDFNTWLVDYWVFFCAAVLIFVLYHVVQWSIWGQTIGKHLTSITVVDREGNRPQFGRALLRMTGYFPSFLLGGIGGFLLIAFDPRHQALHDKIAETYVVLENPPSPVPASLLWALPGYAAPSGAEAATGPDTAPALGMANLAGRRSYEEMEVRAEEAAHVGAPQPPEERGIFREITSLDDTMTTGVLMPDMQEQRAGEAAGMNTTPNLPVSEATGALNEQMLRQRVGSTAAVERARELFRQGVEQMEVGVVESERAYWVEPSMARRAAQSFQAAAEIVPSSVAYRYFLGVALRYCEGFEMALREFRRVVVLDPSHYEARQQVAYGQRWHDAFVYPPWTERLSLRPGTSLPEPVAALLPPNKQPVTRLVVLREGSTKVVSVLSRTPRASWARPLTSDLPARINVLLSRTPAGPVIAFYVIVEDKPGDPYKGETFLNPYDPGSPTYDACQLGQNLLSQIHRQSHIYLIFVDEGNRLLLSRRLEFDSQTQVNINQCLYEVQTLPSQIMDPQRFQAAAEWHMEHFSLDQVK